MTFRAKPVVKRSRNPLDSQDRRTLLTNVAFALVIVAAVAILAFAVIFNWYSEHLAPVGSVAGQSITKDQLNDRIEIEGWRLREQERRIQNLVASGRMTQAQAESAGQILQQQAQNLNGLALERIIDNRIQANLATEEGITVTDADIDAKLVEEATTPAGRHVWVIEVQPAVADGETDSTPAQVAAARAKANDARADIEAGQNWEDVAKAVSTDVATRDQGGDLGWVAEDDRSLDEAFVKAAYQLEANGMTPVIEGEDGIFRIGRVTEIQDENVDELFQTKLQNEGVDLAKYREVVRGDVIRTRLEEKIVAEVSKPGPQRRSAEIFIPSGDIEVPQTAVKVRHILYSPDDTVPDSASSPLPTDDPAWTKAQEEAQAAFEKLTANPELFDAMARAESDETAALGTTGSGGKLPGYIAPDDTNYVPEFVEAVSKPGLKDGQVLEPFRTDFGWHVVQIMYHAPDRAQMDKLKAEADSGADFAQLARDYSEDRQTSGSGGDLGWIARGQLDKRFVDAIFAAPVGKTSDVVFIADGGEADGLHLFKVFEEEERTPEGRQLDDLKANAFGDWYAEKKDALASSIDRGEGG
ncbi:MAG TPA: peptidylprolyl isomerase [Candidatus Limnocylindrales bacterium]|nr:peptidylprolyl isomerase [Candidatus Limnocylindrales bacterium]